MPFSQSEPSERWRRPLRPVSSQSWATKEAPYGGSRCTTFRKARRNTRSGRRSFSASLSCRRKHWCNPAKNLVLTKKRQTPPHSTALRAHTFLHVKPPCTLSQGGPDSAHTEKESCHTHFFQRTTAPNASTSDAIGAFSFFDQRVSRTERTLVYIHEGSQKCARHVSR